MEITYREFTQADAEQIKDLLVKIAESIATLNPGRLPTPMPAYRDSYYQNLLDIYEKGRGTIFVALDNDKIVGFVQGELKIQTEEELLEFKPIAEGYMRDIFVLQEYRGQGVAAGLLNKLEAYLRSKGCTQYELFVLSTNPALEFYKKHGFTDQVYNLIKSL
jgi:ribosomal protein S18 acetylase RimI-like enzyme